MSVSERNSGFAHILHQLAALLDEQGVAFKPAAYRRAAQVIEELPKDLQEYSREALLDLPGVGKAIADKAIEFVETGKVKAFQELVAKQGGLSAELLDVENLGPKRARQIQAALGVKTVPELIKAAEEGKIRDLPRFSEVVEKKILDSAKNVKERTRRYARSEIQKEAELLLRTIRGVPGVERAEIAGSYRRKKATVGDLDVLVVTKKPEAVSDAIAALPFVRGVVAHGDKKLSFDLEFSRLKGNAEAIRVDVRFVSRDQWGSALLYFTGDKEHNIMMRKKAIARGWKLNEYGVFLGEKNLASREEEDIYDVLKMPFVDPEERVG